MLIWLNNLYLSKLYGARRLLSESPDKGWKLGTINSPLKSIRKTGIQLSRNQAAVDRVRHIAVEDLVVSQEDKPKRHRSACEILQETAILLSSVHRIVHRDLQLKCFK